VLGASYAQIARTGLGFQKTQNGGGQAPMAGESNSQYHRFGSAIPGSDVEKTFFDGIDVSLAGIATLAGNGDAEFLTRGLTKMNDDVEQAIAAFAADHPEKVAPMLADGLMVTTALMNEVASSTLSDQAKFDIRQELLFKQTQFNNGIAQAMGLFGLANVTVLDEGRRGGHGGCGGVQPTFTVAIPGQSFPVRVHVVNQSSVPVTLDKVHLTPTTSEQWDFQEPAQTPTSLANNKAADVCITAKVPDNAGYTRPYFSRPSIAQPYYDINIPQWLNRAEMCYPLMAQVHFTYNGAPVQISQIVQVVKRTTGMGTYFEPLVVGPAISVAMQPTAGVVPLDAKTFTLTATLHSNVKGAAKGTLHLDLPAGWKSAPAKADFALEKDGEDRAITFTVRPVQLQEKSYVVTAVAEYNSQEYKEGYHVTGYPGVRPYPLYRPAEYKTSGVNAKVAPGLNVAYITGSGDAVPQVLENLGIKVHFLTPGDLATGELQKYNVILLGVRTYAIREDLHTYNSRLMDYVKNGGVMIVQYNTPEFDHNYGPYPYTMGRNPEEVTDEVSKMEILAPNNPIFQWPNKITLKDFDGWVEERGSKFLRAWDSHYEALLSTHDKDQAPQKGGLVYARYGKGVWVYNAYAFYRQLPAGVPGAYRLIANMVSLPKNPATTGRAASSTSLKKAPAKK